jgi:hypothetical protein
MQSAAAKLEKRVNVLEQQLRQIKSELRTYVWRLGPWWQQLAGRFKNDPLFDEIIKAGKVPGDGYFGYRSSHGR